MLKKIAVLLFLVIIVFVSGCTDTTVDPVNNTDQVKSEQIPTINLPTGFTYMATLETNITRGNFSKKAIEGVYRTDTGEDIYIDVFKSESPEAVMEEYKATYKDEGYEPFTEIYFNGHKATKVTTQFISDGRPANKYRIIWTTKDSMINVGSSTDAQKAINLATATNS
ncbi:MAG: hypothetical protein FIB07_06440 [Candidatus Methanoperedens sp.]|nr:hypothetical protein [Candidatus Methanoperedens sp.]